MHSNIAGKLTKKIGPLPAWAWVLVIVGGYMVARYLRGRSANDASAPVTSGAVDPAGTDPSLSFDGGGPAGAGDGGGDGGTGDGTKGLVKLGPGWYYDPNTGETIHIPGPDDLVTIPPGETPAPAPDPAPAPGVLPGPLKRAILSAGGKSALRNQLKHLQPKPSAPAHSHPHPKPGAKGVSPAVGGHGSNRTGVVRPKVQTTSGGQKRPGSGHSPAIAPKPKSKKGKK